MNEEKEMKAAYYASRIVENCVFQNPGIFSFMPRMVQNGCRRINNKRDSRLFIFLPAPKEQGNRTGNPKISPRLFAFLLCIPCPAGQRPLQPAPDGRQVRGHSTTLLQCARWLHCRRVVLQACISSPAGRLHLALPGYPNSRSASITLKQTCYGK